MSARDLPEPEEISVAPLPPITEEQWDRILAGRKVRWLIDAKKVEWAGNRARSCGNCKHTHMHGDPRRGWCTEHRFAVSLAFPVLCRGYEPN